MKILNKIEQQQQNETTNSKHYSIQILLNVNFCRQIKMVSDLASIGRRWLEYLGLHVTRQIGVDRQDNELPNLGPKSPNPVLQEFLTSFNLLLTSQKDQNVSQRLCCMYLQYRNHTGIHVVCLWCFCVVDVHWESPTLN